MLPNEKNQKISRVRTKTKGEICERGDALAGTGEDCVSPAGLSVETGKHGLGGALGNRGQPL